MMPTDFDKVLDRYLVPHKRDPLAPGISELDGLDRVSTSLGPRETPRNDPNPSGLDGLGRVGAAEPTRETSAQGAASIAPFRSGVPGFAETVAHLLGLPLARFAEAGQMLEVRVPWLPVTLWFVPDEPAVAMLLGEGLSRGRIWTAGELLDLLRIPDLTTARGRTVALAKLGFDGEVVTVRPEGSDALGGRPGLPLASWDPP
jgi:hypothetical protein